MWQDHALLALILVAGVALRLYGLNWDGGHWLHPDERQIYFTVLDLDWPRSLGEALSPDSPLNPQFFAYGSLPIYLLKLVAAGLSPLWPALRSPDNLHLVGRPLSILVDLGTVYLTYRLARKLGLGSRVSKGTLQQPSHDRLAALFAASLVSLAVLPIQLAHFYTADTLLAFLVLLTLNLAADVALGAGRLRRIALGAVLGLALATKVSAAPLVLAVVVGYGVQGTEPPAPAPATGARLRRVLLQTASTLVLAGLVFAAVQPYALLDWPAFLDDTIREAQIAGGTLAVPYTVQYAGTLPFLYSMWQTALWGLGLPLGLVAWPALAWTLVRWLRRGLWSDALLVAWAGPTFVIAGLLQARHLRYMLPLVSILSIATCQLLARLPSRRIRAAGYGVLGLGTVAYALLFASIYVPPHSWIAASAWIYEQVPAESTLAIEHWDTPLPLPLEKGGVSWRSEAYDIRTLTLYDEPDGEAKWEALTRDLAAADYLVIASRRLYGSIPRAPDRYPVAGRYYELLFGGELGFEVVGEFSRGPDCLNPRLPPLPNAAPAWLRPDESFVVYDHPRALVLRNEARLPAGELLQRLGL